MINWLLRVKVQEGRTKGKCTLKQNKKDKKFRGDYFFCGRKQFTTRIFAQFEFHYFPLKSI